jgi:hypothetical protein
MGDSQQPKPALPQFEVPDLELEPVVRPARAAGVVTPTPSPARGRAQEYTAPNLFDEDALSAGSPTIDLGLAGEGQSGLHFGAGASFDSFGQVELEGNAHSGLALEASALPHSGVQLASAPLGEAAAAAWPSGHTPARELLAIDPLELSLLAAYGEPPKSAYLTPAYAYRVFQRQRELKSLLAPLEVERARAEAERESTLADLARAVRPQAEGAEQFRRLFAPLLELEQLASQRGQALSSVNAQLSAQANALDAGLGEINALLETERAREHDAQRCYDERDASAQRAHAKLKRVHIEMRAVTQVAEQKLGPRGGQIPEPEASQLAALKERAGALEPEVDQAKAELAQAKLTLDRASASVGAAGQRERLAGRKKQALVQHYQAELDLRGRGSSENEQQQQAALVELGRALLAARGAVAVPPAWLERVRGSSQCADSLLARCELHLRALDAYDRPKVTQGVRLACTLAALAVLLIVLKIAL